MRNHIALAFGVVLPLFAPAIAGDENLLSLEVEIHVDGELISTPRLALEPGGDASIQQGIGDELALKIVFHSTHLVERGAGVLTDIDFGRREPEHVQAQHLVMPWNEPHEIVFSTAVDGPSIRLRITPSRVKRSELMLWPERAGS